MIQGYDNEFNKITPSIRRLSTEMREVRWKPDRELTLTRVPNTQITCRLCRGSKFAISKSMYGNYGDMIPCPNCDGTGKQFSDKYDDVFLHRNR